MVKVSTQQQITIRLARLRAWRDLSRDEEAVARETVSAHNEINRLLDELDKSKVLK